MPEDVGVADGLGLADDDLTVQEVTPQDAGADDGGMDDGVGDV
jgi:hypothetical protein